MFHHNDTSFRALQIYTLYKKKSIVIHLMSINHGV